jgi:uncharacterized DUF497 family protein
MFEWDSKKNAEIKKERKISFEDVVFAIHSGALLDILDHPNQEKYPGQKLLIVKINDYVWVVPAEKRGNRLRLVTAYPSRKYTKRYLGGKR